jgi:hypothetical protein
MRCKRIAHLLVPLFLLYGTAKSQTFTASFETGYSINHSAIAGFTAGVNFKYFSIRAGMDAHLTNKVKDGIILKTIIGHTFEIGERFYGTAGIGHAYLYKSADKKSLNSNKFLINPEIGYKFELKGEPFALYTGYINAGEHNMILCGVRGYF